MANLMGFDASTVPEQQDFSALPEGQYVVIATTSEMKPNKAGNGQYLKFVFEVLDGPMKGRKLWARMNLVNPNQTAVEIAQRELAAFCRAVGVIKPNDSSELHNKPVLVTVTCEKDDRNRETNEIKKYEALSGMASATAAQTPQASAPAWSAPAATNGSTPPWAK